VLILNADPVFQDSALEILDSLEDVETRIARTLSEAVLVLLEENFNALVLDGEPALAIEQATNVRQHFPSLSGRRLRRTLANFVRSLDARSGTPAEGIDPCHSLIGNLNQFSAPEILQMSCLSQRSGRFTFKSGRGNSEIYLQRGSVRHAVFGSLEGESAVAEIFRWREGRFYFEEGIISQVQSVDRPWEHLLIDNLQKLDETLKLVSVSSPP
jgi:hypothetical protein